MTYKYYKAIHSVIINQYPKYDVNPSNCVGDIKQNHWTIKYRSHRSRNEVTHRVILNQYPKYDVNPLNSVAIISKITRSWNIGQHQIRYTAFGWSSQYVSVCQV